MSGPGSPPDGGFCTQCGSALGAEARFCESCGTAVERAAPPAAAPAPSEAAHAHVGPQPVSAAVGTPPRKPPRRRRPWVVLAAVGLTVACAAVAAAVMIKDTGGKTPEDRAARLVPADTIAYGTIFLDPSADQQKAVGDLLDRFGVPGSGGSNARPVERIERLFTGDVSAEYERYVKPVLGNQLAVYVSRTPVVMIATKDADAARASIRHFLEDDLDDYDGSQARLRSGSHSGVTLYMESDYEGSVDASSLTGAVVGGFVIFGERSEVMKAIDARGGRTLAASDRYKDAVDQVPDDAIAFGYLDPKALIDDQVDEGNLSRTEATVVSALAPSGAVAATLSAESDGLVAELAAGGANSSLLSMKGASDFLETLPKDATAAISFGDVGSPLRKAVADGLDGGVSELSSALADATGLNLQSDVVDWVGRVGAYFVGTSVDVVDGAAVAETRSPSDSRRALSGIVSRYANDEYSGFSSTEDGGLRSDDGVEVHADEDRVISGSGVPTFDSDRALDGHGGFEESDALREARGALGGAWSPFLAVDARRLRGLFESADTAPSTRFALSQIGSFAGGYKTEGDWIHLRVAAKLDGSGDDVSKPEE